jgi:hypothetical protein
MLFQMGMELVVRGFVSALVLASGVALAVACSSSNGDPPPEEPATPPLGTPDTGTSGSSGSSGVTDASSSGTDSNASSSGGPFCSTQTPKPAICEDFDDDKEPWAQNAAKPTIGDTDGPGTIAIEKGGTSKSTPNALKVVGNDAQETVFRLPSNDVNNPTKFTIGFAYRPETAIPTQGSFAIQRTFLANNHALTIEFSSQEGAVLREAGQNGEKTGKISKIPTVKTWTRYELVVDISGKKATLTADGTKVAELALQFNGFDLFAANFGVATESAAHTSYYDDITVDLK